MVSLVDIGPLSSKVTLRGQDVEVRGVPVITIFEILQGNTAVKKMFLDRSLKAEDIETLIASTPLVFGQIIAAATGKPGDDETIKFAMFDLYAGEQAMIIEKALSLSFPQGLQSFMDTLTGMFSGEAGARSGKVAVTS